MSQVINASYVVSRCIGNPPALGIAFSLHQMYYGHRLHILILMGYSTFIWFRLYVKGYPLLRVDQIFLAITENNRQVFIFTI